MNTLWQVPAVVLTLVTWLTSPPANLAEVAHREQLRRSMTAKSVASYSNDNLRPDMFPVRVASDAGGATSEIASATSATSEVAVTAAPPAPTSEMAAMKPVAPVALDEKAWRSRMADARTTLDRDQGLVEAMQSRINALQTESIMRDDPAQQAAKRQTLQKALAELERLQKQVALDQKAIADIQTDARKANVPPGWVR
jgi:hypothetical protein